MRSNHRWLSWSILLANLPFTLVWMVNDDPCLELKCRSKRIIVELYKTFHLSIRRKLNEIELLKKSRLFFWTTKVWNLLLKLLCNFLRKQINTLSPWLNGLIPFRSSSKSIWTIFGTHLRKNQSQKLIFYVALKIFSLNPKWTPKFKI